MASKVARARRTIALSNLLGLFRRDHSLVVITVKMWTRWDLIQATSNVWWYRHEFLHELGACRHRKVAAACSLIIKLTAKLWRLVCFAWYRLKIWWSGQRRGCRRLGNDGNGFLAEGCLCRALILVQVHLGCHLLRKRYQMGLRCDDTLPFHFIFANIIELRCLHLLDFALIYDLIFNLN